MVTKPIRELILDGLLAPGLRIRVWSPGEGVRIASKSDATVLMPSTFDAAKKRGHRRLSKPLV